MLFREHRGGLQESMKTVVDLQDRAGLIEYIRKLLDGWGVTVTDDTVDLVKYNDHGDARIGWDELYVVTIKWFGVIGWANGDFDTLAK